MQEDLRDSNVWWLCRNVAENSVLQIQKIPSETVKGLRIQKFSRRAWPYTTWTHIFIKMSLKEAKTVTARNKELNLALKRNHAETTDYVLHIWNIFYD